MKNLISPIAIAFPFIVLAGCTHYFNRAHNGMTKATIETDSELYCEH